MSDPIDRQAAIDVLDKIFNSIPMEQTTEILILRRALREMPPAQPEPQWIPCSERLPEEKDAGILKKLGVNKRSDHVLATVKAKGEYMTVQTCTYDGVWHWDMKYAFPDYEIIAWMPLPDPYKERREE